MRLSRRSLLLGSAFAVWAQQPKFSAGVDVVTLMATVRDKEGHIAKNLAREDFVLEDNGKRQTISYFSQESDLPLTIGLLVDTSRSQRFVIEQERTASYKFLDQVLREGKDSAFVSRFDVDVAVVQGFTSSREELAAALGRLTIPDISATVIYDAIRQTSEDQMRKQKGRKAFILLSDGVSFKDPTTLSTAIEYAQRADTIIYSILYGGGGAGLRRPVRTAAQGMGRKRGRVVMERLARETGGAYFEVSANNPIGKIYAEIEDALRNQYSIGYTPQGKSKIGEYRKIKLTTKKRGLLVQTRDGYYQN